MKINPANGICQPPFPPCHSTPPPLHPQLVWVKFFSFPFLNASVASRARSQAKI